MDSEGPRMRALAVHDLAVDQGVSNSWSTLLPSGCVGLKVVQDSKKRQDERQVGTREWQLARAGEGGRGVERGRGRCS
jgi:hypothetical protein